MLRAPILPPLTLIIALAVTAAQIHAQTPTGTVILYRPRGANFGVVHYAQGVHPTVSCDGVKIARLGERRRTTIMAKAGTHSCVAVEKQYPGMANADSDSISINVKPDRTTYLRLECPFGQIHFVLHEVSPETAKIEVEKMRPVRDKESFTTTLTPIEEKQPTN